MDAAPVPRYFARGMVGPLTARASTAAGMAAALAVGLSVTPARAQAPTFLLRWEAPTADCPDEAYVRGAVHELLGGEDPAAARVEARAQVERVAEGVWRVRLSTLRDGARGERVVESSSCKSLADATAFIVALAIDAQRVASVAPSVPVSAPAPEPPPEALALERAPAPYAPLPSSHFAAFAAFSGDLGTFPRAAYGFHVGGALLFPGARLEAYGAFWPSQHVHDTSAPAVGGDVFLAAGGVRVCWVPLRGVLAFAACPGLELGVLHGQGTGIREPRSNDGIWFAATALARITWRIGPSWALFLDASLVVPFERDQFALDQQTIYQAARVEGVASAGPELQF
jgi:hypothetical protein